MNSLDYKSAMRKKYANYWLAEKEFREKKEFLTSRPYYAFIDPCTVCNLHCPFCGVGKGLVDHEKRLMSFDEFKHVIDQVGEYLLEASVFQYGEPLMNPDIYRMIEYAKSFYIYTRVSTNLTILNYEKAEKLVASGLDYLTVCIDGASQETYSQYRVGGNYKTVLDNLKLILKAKKRLESKTPLIAWQFLLFRHNEHEIETARALSIKMGVDLFLMYPAYVPPENPEWIPSENVLVKYGFLSKDVPAKKAVPTVSEVSQAVPMCKWLWSHLVVSSNGTLTPCCRMSINIPEAGNLFESKIFDEVWNSDGLRSARRFFITGQSQEPKTVCETCPIVDRSVVKLDFMEIPEEGEDPFRETCSGEREDPFCDTCWISNKVKFFKNVAENLNRRLRGLVRRA